MVFLKQTVVTPYGRGIVQEITPTKITIHPTTWQLANDQKPIFYMNVKDVEPYHKVGDRIKCTFGYGAIVSIRDEDGIYVITLTNWALADGKSPTLYLNEQSFTKDLPLSFEQKQEEKKKLISFNEVYSQSLQLKEQAKELYQSKKFTDAKLKYTEALEILKSAETELSNDEKGKFVEISIFCHSNLALCAFNESDIVESIRYGQSTIHLIEAIEKQGSENVVWVALQSSGVTGEKLREQKIKVWRILAKCEIKRQNFEEAKEIIKSALAITSNEKVKKELSDILADTQKRLSQLKKKEKSMWQKAFKKGSVEPEEEFLSAPSPSKAIPQTTNGHSSAATSTSTAAETKSTDLTVEEELAKFNADFKKQFQGVSNPPKKATKTSTRSKPKAENFQVSKYDKFLYNTYFATFALVTSLSLIGAVATYWWKKR